MIKLSRLKLPDGLKELLEDKKRELLEFIDTMNKNIGKNKDADEAARKKLEKLRSGYRIPELKDLLRKESHSKCIYCESLMEHVSFGDMEHIIPKSKVPEYTFEHENLGLGCTRCNTGKSTYHKPDAPLINPYIDDPEVEFVALGPLINARPGRTRAQVTVIKLDLNRAALFEKRKDRILVVGKLADQAIRAPDELREILIDELLLEAGPDKEFSFVVNHSLQAIL